MEQLPKKIEPILMVRQRTGRDCRLCCVAMVADAPYQHVLDVANTLGWHQDNWDLQQVAKVLAWYQVHTWYDDYDRLNWDGVYIVTVPSLNAVGDMHSVVMDVRHGGEPIILDPARGLRGRDYYGIHARADLIAGNNPQLKALLSWSRALRCERIG